VSSVESGLQACGIVFGEQRVEEKVEVLTGVLPTASFAVLPLLPNTCVWLVSVSVYNDKHSQKIKIVEGRDE